MERMFKSLEDESKQNRLFHSSNGVGDRLKKLIAKVDEHILDAHDFKLP